MALENIHKNSIFSDLPNKIDNRFTTGKMGVELKTGTKTSSTEFQFGNADVFKLLLEREKTLYSQFSARDGSEAQPFLETRINDPNRKQRSGESRAFPIRSQLQQAKRSAEFLITSKGVNFTLKQFALQALNPTLETKVWNPLSIIFGKPFVHINRHLSLASAARFSNILTLGLFSSTLTSVADVKNYSQAISKIPLQHENVSRIKYQSPYAFSTNNEKPGLQMANRGRDLIASKKAFVSFNPNRYLFPVSADGGGLPLSSLMSPQEEMQQKIGLANAAFKFTKATGFNQENYSDQNSPNIKSVLTGLLRGLIPEPIRRPVSQILGLLKVSEFGRADIKIFNNYNPTFPYLENASARENINPKIRGVNESRDQKVSFENKSPLTEILGSVEKVGVVKAAKNIPYTFKSEGQLKDRLQTIRDNRVGDYLQSYGELSAKSAIGSGLSLNTLTRAGQQETYEQRKLKTDKVIYKAFGFANAGAVNKDSRFFDRVNALDVGEDYSSDLTGNITDLVPFKFFHINENRFIVFRSTFTGVNESVNPSWNEKTYVGRADPVYTYTGATRKLNFNFDIHPESAVELAPLWKKINALVGLCYPNYVELVGGGEYMVAPFVKLTIGDLYNDVPGIIENLTVSPDDSGTWEISQGLDELGNALSRLPRYIRISVSYAIIGNEQFSSTAKFYDYTF